MSRINPFVLARLSELNKFRESQPIEKKKFSSKFYTGNNFFPMNKIQREENSNSNKENTPKICLKPPMSERVSYFQKMCENKNNESASKGDDLHVKELSHQPVFFSLKKRTRSLPLYDSEDYAQDVYYSIYSPNDFNQNIQKFQYSLVRSLSFST